MKLKDEYILAPGMFSLVLSSILRYLDLQYLDFSISSFFGGLFTGLSLVLNLFYLITLRNKLGKGAIQGERVEGDK